MRKRNFVKILILVALFLIGTIVLCSCEKTANQENSDFTFSLSELESSLILEKYNGDESSVIIPEYVNDLKVSKISKRAFEGKSLSSITIPDTVEVIEEEAFRNCVDLESITFPTELKTLGRAVLNGCKNIKSVSVPFSGKSGSITEPSTRTLFGYIFGTERYEDSYICEQFYVEDEITPYYIPESLEEISITGSGNILTGSFTNLKSVKKVLIANGITAINSNAFYNCDNLEEISIDAEAKLKTIGGYAFYNCSKLSTIAFPKSLVSIGEYAFYNTNIENVNLLEKCNKLEKYCFSNCLNLKNVTMHNSSVALNEGVFSNCQSLVSIQIPVNLLSVPKSFLANCTSLQTIDLSNTLIISIQDEAFKGCTNLKSIKFSKTISSINTNAFKDCEKLETAIFDETIREFKVSLDSIEYLVQVTNPQTNATNLKLTYSSYIWTILN
ncbi:MAG: leucine-rich repeat domain-containing protein [Clostridia bacterium]|nr:leucine-rich repeat domain-containing protein [Clostridia bacterium]